MQNGVFQLRVEISTLVVLVTVFSISSNRFAQIWYSIVGYTLVVVSFCVFDVGAIKVQELRSEDRQNGGLGWKNLNLPSRTVNLKIHPTTTVWT